MPQTAFTRKSWKLFFSLVCVALATFLLLFILNSVVGRQVTPNHLSIREERFINERRHTSDKHLSASGLQNNTQPLHLTGKEGIWSQSSNKGSRTRTVVNAAVVRNNFTNIRAGIGGSYNGTHMLINRHLFIPDRNRYFTVLMPDGSSPYSKETTVVYNLWTSELWGLISVFIDEGWILHHNQSEKPIHMYITKTIVPKHLDRKTQLINHIGSVGNTCLAGNKLQQLNCRRAFARFHGCEFEDLYISPPQYDMDDPVDCKHFFKVAEHEKVQGKMYLLKPIATEHGDGIRVLRSFEDAKAEFGLCSNTSRSGMIAMEYVSNPATLGGRKFDIRTFLLIAALRPKMVFYHDGYGRLSAVKFSQNTTDEKVHITNARNMGYFVDRFQDFSTIQRRLTTEHGYAPDHFERYVRPRAIAVSRFVFEAGIHEMSTTPGRFQLYGLDWAIDDKGKIGLLEVNASPLMLALPGVPTTLSMWANMMKLVFTLQGKPKGLGTDVTTKSGFEYRGWKLIYNDLEQKYMEEQHGKTYDACEPFLEQSRWTLPDFKGTVAG